VTKKIDLLAVSFRGARGAYNRAEESREVSVVLGFLEHVEEVLTDDRMM
jgi:hypothetical protein